MATEGGFLGVVHTFAEVAVSGKATCTPRPALLAKAISVLQGLVSNNCCTPAEASKFRGVQGFLKLALFGQVSKQGARPFTNAQYRDRQPWTRSHTMRRAIDFYLAIFSDCPRRSIQLWKATAPLAIIASDAQVESDVYLVGGYLIYDPASGRRFGAWCEFREGELAALGTSMAEIAAGGQTIARCESAMFPILLHHETHYLQGQDILWLVGNTAALGGVVKGASGLAVSEGIIAAFWMEAFALESRIWLGYVDSGVVRRHSL